MKIGIASDHAGYDLKSAIIKEFGNKEFSFVDYGCNDSLASVDYPDIASNLCHKFIDGEFELGILICGSGIGVSIAANRFNKIRAALCHNKETSVLARQHNDANILCLGARVISEDTAFEAVRSFLSSKFLGGRHENRVNKLSS